MGISDGAIVAAAVYAGVVEAVVATRRCGRVRFARQPGVRIGLRGAVAAAEREEVEQLRIAQLRGPDVAQGAGDGLDAPGRLALPLRHHLLHLLALQVLL